MYASRVTFAHGRTRTLLAALWLLATACASSGFDGRVFRSQDMAFELREIPGHWRSLDSSDTLLSFRDDQDQSSIAVNGRCGKDAQDVPLRALTQHLFLQFTEREVSDERLLSLDGREAMRTQLQAKLDGVRKHFIVVVLKKDGCIYDFLYVAAAQPSAQAESEFDRFVSGFATLD